MVARFPTRFAVVAALTLAAQGAFAQSSGGRSSSGDHSGDHASMQMHESMMRNMKDMQTMKPSGDIDVDFAQMMRHHHLAGIEMAKQEAENGKDAKMREMAKRTISEQQKDVREFDDWLKAKGVKAK